MIFQPPLLRGTLIRRYKRFLADITLDSGDTITAHCANTGSMRSCSEPGSPVGISRSPNPKRKYPHTLEIICSGEVWIGINTARTNSLVVEAIELGRIDEFKEVKEIKREVTVSGKSRLDLQLFTAETSVFVEVKNCSLVEDRCAMFPDAVTARGAKHLEELTHLANSGAQAAMFFLVQRGDARCFRPAAHIDPDYSTALRRAAEAGVQLIAYQAEVSPEGIEVIGPLSVSLD
jgi:sugar fermentation stimulation protein A